MIRSYSELQRIETFEDRFRYLALKGSIGRSTFGFDRHINQTFYASRGWKQLRKHIIARDLGCDLGVEGHEIHRQLLIHHMNPITAFNITHGDPDLLNPDVLITTTTRTHNAIHFGDERQLPRPLTVRQPGDTRLW